MQKLPVPLKSGLCQINPNIIFYLSPLGGVFRWVAWKKKKKLDTSWLLYLRVCYRRQFMHLKQPDESRGDPAIQ